MNIPKDQSVGDVVAINPRISRETKYHFDQTKTTYVVQDREQEKTLPKNFEERSSWLGHPCALKVAPGLLSSWRFESATAREC
jgi:hypothetical protein